MHGVGAVRHPCVSSVVVSYPRSAKHKCRCFNICPERQEGCKGQLSKWRCGRRGGAGHWGLCRWAGETVPSAVGSGDWLLTSVDKAQFHAGALEPVAVDSGAPSRGDRLSWESSSFLSFHRLFQVFFFTVDYRLVAHAALVGPLNQ